MTSPAEPRTERPQSRFGRARERVGGWLQRVVGWLQRIVGWLRRHKLEFAIVLAVAFGLLVGRWSGGDGAVAPDLTHAAHPDGSAHENATPSDWTCSMHPQIHMPGPGKCPICGMDLIPSAPAGSGSGNSATEVVLTERAKILARVETVEVRRRGTTSEIRLLAKLEPDETRVRTISPWVDGRIDRLYVSALGEQIKRGQAVASLYSPEVYAAQADLIAARAQTERLTKALPVAQVASQSAYEAAKTRLRLLGLSASEVEKMSGADSSRRNVAVISSYSGTVIEQFVHEGAYVKAGTPLYKIADLSLLWAQLDAYENDLARIVVDQKVSLQISSYPGEIFEGTVAFLDPVVDPRTRTARVRVKVDNGDGRLRAGMFADAVVHAPEVSGAEIPLVVPESAPLFTGTRSVVYVEVPDRSKPTYEPREVRLGPRAGRSYPVVAGLQAGERVVVHGAFAIDSDLQIRGGRSMMTMDDDLTREQSAPIDVPESFREGMRPLFVAYLATQRALAADDFELARSSFADASTALGAFEPNAPAAAVPVWDRLAGRLRAPLVAGGAAHDIAAARVSFENASLIMIELARRFGNPSAAPLRLAFCPMASGGKGALWLQEPAEIDNPYFGAAMRQCGEIRQVANPGVRLPAATDSTAEGAAPAGGEPAAPSKAQAGHVHP